MDIHIFEQVKREVSDTIDLRRDINDEELQEIIIHKVFEITGDMLLNTGQRREIADNVFNSLRRLDVLQPIIDDKSVTEIMINGAESIFIERQGNTKQLPLRFETTQKLEDIIQIIVSSVNRSVNESSPIVDARLKDGSRINAVLPPIALNGPILTIRKFPEQPMSMEKLVEYNSLTEEAAQFLSMLVKAKYNIFVSGGTGSGKTTFLNALSGCIPSDERIITIEDSAELQIQNVLNLVRLETRNCNVEGKGEITMRDLIKTSLRMRPDRIIVGEVRGAEAIDMLMAMNTGHDGSLSTGHANSSEDMFSRLETMILSSLQLPLDCVRKQIASAIDIIIHLSRLRDKSRRTMEISEVIGLKDNIIVLNPIFVFEEHQNNDIRTVSGSLKRTKNKFQNTYKLSLAGINYE